jgi:hypothetical protein
VRVVSQYRLILNADMKVQEVHYEWRYPKKYATERYQRIVVSIGCAGLSP